MSQKKRTAGTSGGAHPGDAQTLSTRVDALDKALVAGGDQLNNDVARRARAVVKKVSERTSLTGDHTVVALAGATGSGKSSLFNAIVGEQVAAIGARRPTTSTPTAAVWGFDSAGTLLDWLEVGRRHQVFSGDDSPLNGLVLLDLPDFDSRELANHVEAERILELVDLFVWVTDPQKYADARLHHDYVSALSTHDAVMMVVLNQVDRLTPEAADRCQQDLRRLLHMDGLRNALVVPTSVMTGEGMDELERRLATAVAGAKAARTRLIGDVSAVAGLLESDVASSEAEVPDSSVDRLVGAMSTAAGLPMVVRAVERDYHNEAVAASGWPLTRWLRRLRRNPLGRLRLDPESSAITEADLRTAVGRSSIPPPSPSARASVAVATRRIAEEAGQGLPARWSRAVEDAAQANEDDVADALDQAVLATPLRESAPKWWTVMGILQVLLTITALVGLGWLAALAVWGVLRLPEFPTPYVGPVALPTILVGVGLVVGILLAWLSRLFARVGARRRGRRVSKRLRSAVAAVAIRQVIDPVDEVLDRHAETRKELLRAQGQ